MLLPCKAFSPGDGQRVEPERHLSNLALSVHKFNNRIKPTDIRRITLFPVFNEFGSELISVLYVIPYYLQNVYPGNYGIAMGWHGRDFLYRYLLDEFWELAKEHSWLRNYCRAFHHDSRNLGQLERKLYKTGRFVTYSEFGSFVNYELYPNIKKYIGKGAFPPIPGDESKSRVSKFLTKPRLVGINARNRRTYGRNLPIEFYVKLVELLESKGYSVVWLGEPVSTHECPLDRLINYRDSEEASDLSNTMALISQLEFTIQFYTASTRVPGLVGTPFILVESPDQLWGSGQEGLRLELCSKGPKKIVASDFRSFESDQEEGLMIVKQAIEELENKNYNQMIGLVGDSVGVLQMIIEFNEKYGFNNEKVTH